MDVGSWLRRVAMVGAGAAAIALGAQISIPLGPIPMTLQTLAVVVVGLAGGPWVGLLAGALYVLAVGAGLPVLAGGAQAPGAALLELKSVGYVIGFVLGGAAAGLIGHRRGVARMVLGGLAAHAVILLAGVPVLAGFIGLGGAIEHGLLPVLPGALVKSLVGAGAVAAVGWLWARWRRREEPDPSL